MYLCFVPYLDIYLSSLSGHDRGALTMFSAQLPHIEDSWSLPFDGRYYIYYLLYLSNQATTHPTHHTCTFLSL